MLRVLSPPPRATTRFLRRLQPLLGYWAITIDDMRVNGQIVTGANASIGVVDTGTSVICGPPKYMDPGAFHQSCCGRAVRSCVPARCLALTRCW